MPKKKSEPIEHHDQLGQLIKMDDIVAYVHTTGYSSSKGTLAIGKVIGFTPKFVKIAVAETVWRNSILRYPIDTLIMQDDNIKRIMLAKMKGNKMVKNI